MSRGSLLAAPYSERRARAAEVLAAWRQVTRAVGVGGIGGGGVIGGSRMVGSTGEVGESGSGIRVGGGRAGEELFTVDEPGRD